jgi:hypothetical protein
MGGLDPEESFGDDVLGVVDELLRDDCLLVGSIVWG